MIDKYSYQITWSEEDQAYLASVLEFPSLMAHGESREEALREISQVVQTVLADLKAANEPIPEPMSLRSYSGKFNLRIPAELHRRLATEAHHQRVSLNMLIRQKLENAG